MSKYKWYAIGIGLGVAAIGFFVLKKTGLLNFGGCECDYEGEEEDCACRDCVIDEVVSISEEIPCDTGDNLGGNADENMDSATVECQNQPKE